jgi:natural product precursor
MFVEYNNGKLSTCWRRSTEIKLMFYLNFRKMKKISKIALTDQNVVLTKNEMQKVLGGGSYTCHCSYWSWGSGGCEHVDTGNISAYMAQYCPGGGYCTENNPNGGCPG